MIPGSGRSAGKGIGYRLQYSWASLVAQLVKIPPAMQETWVRSLGWEDSPGERKGYPLQYSGLENSVDCIVHGVPKELDTTRNGIYTKTSEGFPHSLELEPLLNNNAREESLESSENRDETLV